MAAAELAKDLETRLEYLEGEDLLNEALDHHERVSRMLLADLRSINAVSNEIEKMLNSLIKKIAN